MNIIDFENINVGYDEKIVLKNITLKIKEKEHWAILGANGSGKSTLMKLIQSEIHPRKTNPYKKEILGKATYSIFELKKDFGWKDTYSIGDETIDAEHKKLLDIAKEAFEEVEPILRLIKVREVLSELYTYMKTHFIHEEMYMKKIKYPHLKEHKALHDEIVEKINHFVKKLPTMKDSVFEKELANIIDIALVHHIILEDKKIVDWINSNSVIK